ncbi:hypothetical protein EBF03_04170 [Arcanobacterium haemolyticum]|uniref:Peptidase A24A prepilin type IV n=1 Tax=Arcanobacterium haemolyticum (strain ATCC 9345 / DSM 20595 / CCM 5947 / CCUG 17215 / LMG 16163 / NBRC 15585 / NCTC 8452 / 11018) TaxID=644284 RepID=D7BNS3_ARCHD|nr:prepilin peptidase [Arcanobacterium haemolyticum]ADH92572.1 hypothetical protein Arch_0846 [Arcanobacterium haemolyticum DSM 20595]QCX46691.1 hypothetical protein EBF03_04170 [Arcanobacterium haemolyticum]SQH28694.1 Uncharacterised protein [Arcanobacterium haemolyticum]
MEQRHWKISCILALICATIAGIIAPNYVTLICATLFFGLLTANAVHDYITQTLLVSLTHATLCVAIAQTLWNYGIEPERWLNIALILTAICVPLWAISRLSRGALIGMGDVRLLVPLIVWHTTTILYVLMLAVISAGIVATAGLVCKAFTRNSTIPFGPFLVGSSWAIWVSMNAVSLTQLCL